MRHIILVPGLGQNHNERVFWWLRPLWRLYGIKLHICELHWEDGRDWAGKYRRLKQLAARLPQPLGVIGASAGASAAVDLLALEPKLVSGVVTLCGLLDGDFLDQAAMQRRSPAFLEALTAADQYLHEQPQLVAKLLTLRPLADGVVAPEVATTPGAKDVVIRTRGHAVSIAYILTFKVGLIKRFLVSLED